MPAILATIQLPERPSGQQARTCQVLDNASCLARKEQCALALKRYKDRPGMLQVDMALRRDLALASVTKGNTLCSKLTATSNSVKKLQSES
jgi:hypothetical protein